MNYSRRDLLKAAAVTAGSLVDSKVQAALPPPSQSGIEHIIVVMMENRSLDHFLGWLPGADGQQSATYYDSNGNPFSTYHLQDYQGCGHPNPDHSYDGGRVEYNGGLCDGWLKTAANDIYAIGYYEQSDLAFLGPAAPAWTTFQRYFAATMAPTYPNRFFMHSAQTDRISNTLTLSRLPTIWDRLSANGLSGLYYFSDVPFLALWGLRHLGITRGISQFFSDCAAGTLPQVAFVDPAFLGIENGTSNGDEPHADIRNGEAFMYQVYRAVTTSPLWPSTVLIFNYDEWGGFFDHVPPTTAPDPHPATNLRGFRVPCLMIAPWARRGFVGRNVYDHTSILKMIEWRWGIRPLTVRDQSAANIAQVLDFSSPNYAAPDFNVPPGPFGVACRAGAAPAPSHWAQLAQTARSLGWPVIR